MTIPSFSGPIMLWYFVAALLLMIVLRKVQLRLVLSLAKHGSLSGHARLARLIARRLPHYEFDERRFFSADDAPPEVAARRRAGFMRLAALCLERYPQGAALTREVEEALSDLQFTARYRVPFQFSGMVRRHLRGGAFLQSSAQSTLTDVDGNRFFDLSGSYGVNLFGYDFYKECIERGSQLVRELGPVLGQYHPVIAYNVRRLREISGLEEVSLHMSGTEAVMQAVRLARYHSGRRYLVRFCGAYHGWWGDVQPGVGNPVAAAGTFTLKDMDPASLRVLRMRRDIACVLVNPLQAMHPNSSAPADSGLLNRRPPAAVERAAYAEWLRQLRAVCSERNIVLIFDEVFVGFRLAAGGAQEYFGVRADMVTYGKTLGGGLPIGVVCGRRELMKRYREERPADICFARGTFNSHPYVMGAMHEFLRRLESEPIRSMYRDLDALWEQRARGLNERLRAEQLPLQISHLSSIWTVNYLQPSRYHWMFQYYLRAEGLALSWVGTARLIFSLNYTDADFAAVSERILSAARAMQRDGWWWPGAALTERAIRRRVLRELLQAWWATSSIGSRSSPRSRYSGARQ
ncbi:MAG TPA: aminotransferase class III-fold pyridoxal phosphate-dependent enzyme [Steroidobacteraceae bacterium]|nr:aminotransferase class III-fold pyridoxal phosphate-dependent enzyme [Steroidobacteraceae bacterium]